MKRKIAKRKLKRRCDDCQKSFHKGDVYYLDRRVIALEKVFAFECIYCPKCIYKNEMHTKRLNSLRESGKCPHPKVEEVWSLIPGEDVVMQPDHSECIICGEWL